MFGGTIWELLFRRSSYQLNRKMLTVAFSLLFFSTVVSVSFYFSWIRIGQRSIAWGIQHLVIDIIRVMEGLILYRDTYPGGPVAFFSDWSQWTFVSKNYLFTVQSLIGDGVIVSFTSVRYERDPLSALTALSLLRGMAI